MADFDFQSDALAVDIYVLWNSLSNTCTSFLTQIIWIVRLVMQLSINPILVKHRLLTREIFESFKVEKENNTTKYHSIYFLILFSNQNLFWDENTAPSQRWRCCFEPFRHWIVKGFAIGCLNWYSYSNWFLFKGNPQHD